MVIAFQGSIRAFGTIPDITILMVYAYGIRNGELPGMTFGAAAGLLLDISSGNLIGPNLLGKAIAGFISGSLRRRVFQWNMLLNFILITAITAVDSTVVYLCLINFLNFPASFYTFINPIAFQSILTGALGFLISPLILRGLKEGLKTR